MYMLFLFIVITILCVIIFLSNKKEEVDKINLEEKVNSSNDTLSDYGKVKTTNLSTRIIKTTNEPIRNVSCSHNMNCDRYLFSAKFTKTGRIRTNKQVVIFEGEDIYNKIKEMGYEEPIQILSTGWDKPSEAQITYLRNVGLLNQKLGICSIDASCLLSTYETGIGIGPRGLYQYATNHRIVTSFYAPEHYLYENIWNSLEGEEKIVFFLFCIYRDKMNCEESNLDCFSKKIYLYDIATGLKADERFIKSMEKYEAKSLMMFGERETKNADGFVVYASGGSKNSIAYKTAIIALKEKGLITK